MQYQILRKEDNHYIKSNNIDFTIAGIWINDDLETGNKDIRVFIPYHNILQILEIKEA